MSVRDSLAEFSHHYLDHLESEAVFIIREVAAQVERPILLFSGGKDSIALAYLAHKAFYPSPVPFPLLHVDTGHNFPETLQFRDRFCADFGFRLEVRSVQDSIDQGRVHEEFGPRPSRNSLQTVTLLDALSELRCEAALTGARRDEEKARAKERVFSHRDRHGQWDPKNQRPELWSLYNCRKAGGEHFRVFPLSNWTELDLWRYLEREKLELPGLYFAHHREVVRTREGVLLAAGGPVTPLADEVVTQLRVRFRTIGDRTCTGAVESKATSVAEVIAELTGARFTERSARADDRRSDSAMEDRKREGYF